MQSQDGFPSQGVVPTLEYVGVGRRLLAVLIDGLLLLLFGWIIATVFPSSGVMSVGGDAWDKFKHIGTGTGLQIALPFAYYIVMESVFARTIGKFVQRVVVVNDEGGKPSLAAVFLRTLTRLVEVNPILFGALPAGLIANFSKSHQRLGDLLAGTFVVATADLPRITHSPFIGEVKPGSVSTGT